MSDSSPTFAGSIPENYDRYMGPAVFEPYAVELARQLPADAMRVLETACGTGRATRRVLDRLSATGTVIATDVNEPMLAHAAELIADPRVTWRSADAQSLPFGAGEFDVVVCQFGLMFVPDKALALREARRVLKAGGTCLIAVWDVLDHNPASALLHRMACALLVDEPAFMARTFSMGDAGALDQLVADAGFASCRIQTVVKAGTSPSAGELAIGFVRGNPLWDQLVKRDLDVDAFQASLAAALASRFGDRPCCSQLSAHVVTAIA